MDSICLLVYGGGLVAVVLILFGLVVALRPSPTERIFRQSQTVSQDAADQVRAAAAAHLRDIGRLTTVRRYQYVAKEQRHDQKA